MTSQHAGGPRAADLIHHLTRFPEDLRDIRRLQRRYGLSAPEVARALETLGVAEGGAAALKRVLTH